MKTLALDFRHDGFDFRLLRRDGGIALYQKSKPGHRDPSFEVAIIQSRNGFAIAGKVIPPSESMPPAEQWGNQGWTYTAIGAAHARFGSLVARYNADSRSQVIRRNDFHAPNA